MKKQAILSMFMMILFFSANAQNSGSVNLSGNISDANSGKTLIAATVAVKNQNNGKLFNALSDTKGSFQLSVEPGIYNVSVDYLGYETYLQLNVNVQKKSQEYKIKEVRLIPKSNELSGVTITSSVKKSFIQQGANKITINVAESPIAAGGNAYDVLLRAPGVSEQNNSLSFRLRTINVLINGKLTNLSGEELKTMLKNLPANTVDKIDIIPNPSAKYDAQGGSIINIKLSDNKIAGINGTVTAGVGAGKYAQYFSGATLNYNQNKLSLNGSYNYQRNKVYQDGSSGRILSTVSSLVQQDKDLLTKNNHTYRVGADYDLNTKNTIGVQLRGSTNELHHSGSNIAWVKDAEDANTSSSTTMSDGITKIDNPAVNLYYKGILDSAGREINFNADYFSYDKEWNDSYITNYFDQAGNTTGQPYLLRANAPGKNRIQSLKIDYTHPSVIGNFEIGIKTIFTKTDNNILWESLTSNQWLTETGKTNHFIYNENIYAGYITYEKAIQNSWQLNAGLRVEKTDSRGNLINTGEINQRNYTNLFPNIGIQYINGLNHIFSLNYRKSIERFGFDIVNPFVKYQNQYAYSQGNPNISPQINHNIEFNYIFKQSLILGASYTRSVNALAPVFRKDANNVVVSSYDNLKSSDFFYIYASYSKTMFDIWNINFVAGTGFYKFDTSTLKYTDNNFNSKWSYLFQTNNGLELLHLNGHLVKRKT